MEPVNIVMLVFLYFLIGGSWFLLDPYRTHGGHIVWWPIYFVRFLIISFWDAVKGR